MTDKSKSKAFANVFKTQIKELERYCNKTDDVINGKNIRALTNLKNSLEKSLEKVEDSYLKYAQTDDFDQNVEYPNLANSKDLAEDSILKIEECLFTLEDKIESKQIDESKDKESKQFENIRLPKYNLVKFDGNIDGWLHFRDLFETTIDKNKSLTPIEKLQFLASSLTDQAAKLIKGFPITNESYQPAWETLCSRFECTREIAFSQINKLLNVKNIKSAKSIREVLDSCNESLRNLKTLGYETNALVELIIIQTYQSKLDAAVRQQWEFSLESKSIPDLNQFITFLEKQARSIQDFKEPFPKPESKFFPKRSSVHNVLVKNEVGKCILCGQGHLLFKCPEFNKMNLDQRWATVKSNRICNNCLRSGHFVSKCLINAKCKACGKNHHSLLHAFKPESSHVPPGTISPQTYTNSENSTEGIPSNTQCFSNHINDSGHILLSTALIKVRDYEGNYVKCRALIDSASQTSLVTKECSSKLKLPLTTTNHSITGINDTIAETTVYKTKLEFVPHCNNELFEVSALVVNKVTTNLPNFVVPAVKWNHIKNLTLADPMYHIQGPVDILIGADLYAELILGQPIIGAPGSPTALKSKLGWLLSGKVTSKLGHSQKILSHHTLLNLDEQLSRFWELEAIPSSFDEKDEDHTCELIYRNTTTRDKSGRFTVNLPFKNGPPLGESKGQAIRRFLSVEKRLNQNPELKAQYTAFMKEYQELGHMQPTNVNEFSEPSQHYYLPHHGVFREQSETTKIRVVFDASAKTTSGVSLNDILMTGPKIQQDLFNILLRFRTHPVALSADVEKMFRQILVKPSHTNFQRIIWRENPHQPLEEFNLVTVSYGTSAAPYLAIRTIQQLAEEEKSRFPIASAITKTDYYVDDLLTGAESEKQAIILVNQLNQLMQSGGFHLRKWSSSHQEVLRDLPSESKSVDDTVHIDDHKHVNLLGLHWNPKRDTLQIHISEFGEVSTKRQLLSAIAKLYDPLGFLSPTTIILKIMMQELWKDKLAWDDPVPPDIIKTWKKFNSQLVTLKTIQIPRYLETSCRVNSFDLHGFCDASSKAFAAVLYSRVTLTSGEIIVRLVASKSRVAPIKSVTLPRLELCSGLLLARLFKAVTLSINNFDKVYFWSDSEISLCWIKSNSSRDPFIKNRVAIINNLTDKSSWYHVPGPTNPADCATRGLMPNRLEHHLLWFKGPPFLSEPVVNIPEFNVHTVLYDQITNEISNEVSLEGQPCQVFLQTEQDGANSFLESYSSFNKLRRITALCLRFITNCRTISQNRTVGFLNSEELQESTLRLVQIAQRLEFQTEIDLLHKQKPLPRDNKCLSLNPFLDQQGLLRVGGRLKHTRLKWGTIHQLLLPKNHHLTQLIIHHFHLKYLHGGAELVLNMLRQQFWIPSGRSQVKKVLRNCMTCFRWRAKSKHPIMGQLPAARVNPARAFQFTGVDLAGPLITKPNVKRSRIKIKSYVALFVCFTTKAIHLEAVSDLTTSSFIASLRRFIARRGKPSEIHSDNATNFKGSKSYLRELYNVYKSENVQNLMADEEIKWRFIPPRSPHMGGLWESNIKTMKSHLIKTCKSKVLNFEELITLLTQIEACLNSRPLTPLSSDPNDFGVLTPGHFLVGPAQLSLPELTISSVPTLLENWKSVQSLRDQFWTRWSKEYLVGLQPRTKWKKSQPDIRVGDLVLVADNNPTLKWPLARVTQTFPGDDGVTRVVELKMQNGTFKRSVHKLCPLPTVSAPSGGGECS